MLSQVLHGRPTQRQAERLVNHVVAMGEDQVVTHEQVGGLIEVKRETDPARYQTVVGTAKRILLREHGIKLLSERGVGYRYPTGDGQLKAGVGTIRRGVKSIGRGLSTCAVVPDKRLTATGCEIRDQLTGQAKYLFELAKTSRKGLQLTVGKTDANPAAKPS